MNGLRARPTPKIILNRSGRFNSSIARVCSKLLTHRYLSGLIWIDLDKRRRVQKCGCARIVAYSSVTPRSTSQMDETGGFQEQLSLALEIRPPAEIHGLCGNVSM